MPADRERSIRARAAQIRAAEQVRLDLIAQVREARKDGATIAELQEWTGYSRRMVFYLLKDSKPA